MNTAERTKAILNHLQHYESVNIVELAEDLGVSSMTIRRDLNKLAERNIVTLVHGGALFNKGALTEYNMPIKQEENINEKKMIAQKAIEFINSGDSIFLDAGTTVQKIAYLLNKKKNIVVLTHSLLAANALSNAKNIKVVMCPGEFRETSMAYMGPLTNKFISEFKINTLFLGVDGIDINSGISVPDISDGITKRELVNIAEKVICVVDHTKFNKSFLFNICSLSCIDTIITDEGLSEEIIQLFHAKNISIVIAKNTVSLEL